MKRRYIALVIGIVILCMVVVISRRHSNVPKAVNEEKPSPTPGNVVKSTPTPTPATKPIVPTVNVPPQMPDVEAQKKFEALYKTPIQFYGKVVDESGKPIEGARVKIMVADVPLSPGKRFDLTSDTEGLFVLTGAHGASVSVSVAKEGYSSLDKSRGLFPIAELQSTKDPNMPTSGAPAIFVLQSLGKAEPLIKVSAFMKVPRTGQPVNIDLSSGKGGEGQRCLRVETWTDDQTKDAQGRYNWKCKVSVPGGGLVERKSAAVFEAPIDGYEESAEISMPQNADRWSSKAQRQYFVKLGNDQYARIQFEMITQGDHFFSIKSYLNPTPSSRNLTSTPTN